MTDDYILMSIATKTKLHIHMLCYLHLTKNVQSIVCCLLEYLSKLTYLFSNLNVRALSVFVQYYVGLLRLSKFQVNMSMA